MPHSSGGGSSSGGHSSHSSSSSHSSYSSHSGDSRDDYRESNWGRSGRDDYHESDWGSNGRDGYHENNLRRNGGSRGVFYGGHHTLPYNYGYGRRDGIISNGYSARTQFIFLVLLIAFVTFMVFLGENNSTQTPNNSAQTINNSTQTKGVFIYSGQYIRDEANLLGNTSDLMTVLGNFGGKTGITVAIVTVYNDEYSTSLEKYAYSRYLQMFNNEDSWLIVISCSRSNPEDTTQWAWEGMQGDNTDSILTKEVLDFFNSRVQNYLYKSKKGSVSTVFTSAFLSLSQNITTFTSDKPKQSDSYLIQ